MHRIAAIPGDASDGNLEYVEQPTAPVIFLSSASSDISSLANALRELPRCTLRNQIRALSLETLIHPSQIDHYIATTASKAKLIIIRIIGSKGHWQYGIEKFLSWQIELNDRKLLLISGLGMEENYLEDLNNVQPKVTKLISSLLREGGSYNYKLFIKCISSILDNKSIKLESFKVQKKKEPTKFNWINQEGQKVGVLFYTSLAFGKNLEFLEQLQASMRNKELNPRILLITSLRETRIANEVLKIFKRENVHAVATCTSFSSITGEEWYIKSIWDKLDVPVIQLITSSNKKKVWEESSIGLDYLDLSMQVVLPEFDGRITSRPCAFKETIGSDSELSTSIKYYKSYKYGLDWVSSHLKYWIDLRLTDRRNKKVTIIIANYPDKNSRMANGVGLDTPKSIIVLLNKLKLEGYYLGEKNIPQSSKQFIDLLVSTRTNDIENQNKVPLDYISIIDYLKFWEDIPLCSRQKIVVETARKYY